jgi:crossover junction endodeoxyribonuclease RuvC
VKSEEVFSRFLLLVFTFMIILGLDPGTATTGYGLVKIDGDKRIVLDFGVISTPAGLELGERLLMLQQDLKVLIEKCRPDKVGVEDLFFATNVKTAMSVAHARGVILCTAYEYGILTVEITPNQVKSAVTGDGNADKQQVQKMVMMMFGLTHVPKPDDAADALAVALAVERMNGRM